MVEGSGHSGSFASVEEARRVVLAGRVEDVIAGCRFAGVRRKRRARVRKAAA
jgi:hypothetical protein